MPLFYCSIFLLTVLVGFEPPAFAQTPGEWKLVYSLEGWHSDALSFPDNRNGLLFIDSSANGGILRSVDGGATWRKDTTVNFGGGTNSSAVALLKPHYFHNPVYRDLYVALQTMPPRAAISHDTGRTWKLVSYDYLSDTNNRYWEWAEWNVFADGQALGLFYSQVDSGTWLAHSSDSANSFNPREGDSFIRGYAGDAIFFDSLHFTLLWGEYPTQFQRTSDGGKSWKLMPLMPAQYLASDLISDGDFNHLYAHGSNSFGNAIDNPAYAYTSDGGEHWRIDSSFGGPRIGLLVPSSQSKLWAFVGKSSYQGAQTYIGSYGRYADSLFYSSDNGQTWVSDGKMFAGDSLIDMTWPDSTHGYITAHRNNTLLVYRYEPTSSVAQPKPIAESQISILGTPNGRLLKFISDLNGPCHIEVSDVKGTVVLQSEISIASSNLASLVIVLLPSGTYTLSLSTLNHMTEQAKFVVVR